MTSEEHRANVEAAREAAQRSTGDWVESRDPSRLREEEDTANARCQKATKNYWELVSQWQKNYPEDAAVWLREHDPIALPASPR